MNDETVKEYQLAVSRQNLVKQWGEKAVAALDKEALGLFDMTLYVEPGETIVVVYCPECGSADLHGSFTMFYQCRCLYRRRWNDLPHLQMFTRVSA